MMVVMGMVVSCSSKWPSRYNRGVYLHESPQSNAKEKKMVKFKRKERERGLGNDEVEFVSGGLSFPSRKSSLSLSLL